jgi:poly(3-hydroxybutyrate) depolymerase
MYREAVQATSHDFARNAQILSGLIADIPFADPFGIARQFSASAEVVAGATRVHPKPAFGITQTMIGGETVTVRDQVVLEKPFCDLVHFECASDIKRPKVLLFAPLSGHYATLLRETVKGLLPCNDVWITDWKDARQVPLSKGAFGFEAYTDYCIDFIDAVDPDGVIGVCQPCPEVAAALAIRAADGRKNPRAAIFMGGPIDARKGPTEVTMLAQKQSLSWFKEKLVMRVPAYYPGADREVYPGFTQLDSFMFMNQEKHAAKFRQLADALVGRDMEAAATIKGFYDEYFAVMDLTAAFYLDTVRLIFQEHALPKGELEHHGQRVDLARVRKMIIGAVEGKRDDITGLGQTEAIHGLCPDADPRYRLVDAGHFGIFSGSKFLREVVPFINSVMGEAMSARFFTAVRGHRIGAPGAHAAANGKRRLLAATT